MKRFLLLMMCLLCCLALTACYQDSDPWPASAPVNETPAVTAAPTQPPVSVTAEPVVQPTPEPEIIPTEEQPAQPERTPGGESHPGING